MKPEKSLLHGFRYTPSYATNIRVTFARARREIGKEHVRAADAARIAAYRKRHPDVVAAWAKVHGSGLGATFAAYMAAKGGRSYD